MSDLDHFDDYGRHTDLSERGDEQRILRDKVVTTRKPQVCYVCEKVMPPGTRAQTFAVREDGTVRTIYHHAHHGASE